ncbi:hypothetical protein [Actinoallomurus sp. CA-142502]|uniref:hypothetical protein n=1 Tax=Actinoallomurus sp. CA-142502 TaxID=3239885 RepID=UPI003D915642
MGPEGQTREAVQHEAAQTAEHARSATAEVAETAGEQARQVPREAGERARHVVDDARQRLSGELDSRTGRAAGGLRQWADELDRMAESGADGSPVRTAVTRLSQGGRQAAGYLDEHGVAGVAERVGEFARRRPGTFLIGAAVTGFLAGRLAKATASAGSAEDSAETPGRSPSSPAASLSPDTPAPPVPAVGGSYGATPYENGAQATPPPGPSGQVR